MILFPCWEKKKIYISICRFKIIFVSPVVLAVHNPLHKDVIVTSLYFIKHNINNPNTFRSDKSNMCCVF